MRTSPVLDNASVSREGSVSPTRRKKKKQNVPASVSPPPVASPQPTTTLNNNVNTHSNHENNFVSKNNSVLKTKTENINDMNLELKSEYTDFGNESVDDLTLEEVDSETELSGAGTSHMNDGTSNYFTFPMFIILKYVFY